MASIVFRHQHAPLCQEAIQILVPSLLLGLCSDVTSSVKPLLTTLPKVTTQPQPSDSLCFLIFFHLNII